MLVLIGHKRSKNIKELPKNLKIILTCEKCQANIKDTTTLKRPKLIDF